MAHSQIIEGDIAIYTKGCYSMNDPEGWARVEANGGLSFNRKGFINFKDDEVILIVGSDDLHQELYHTLDFRYPTMKKSNVIGRYGVYTDFFLMDRDSNQVSLDFLPQYKSKLNDGIFVSSFLGKGYMIFLSPNKKTKHIVDELYKE